MLYIDNSWRCIHHLHFSPGLLIQTPCLLLHVFTWVANSQLVPKMPRPNSWHHPQPILAYLSSTHLSQPHPFNYHSRQSFGVIIDTSLSVTSPHPVHQQILWLHLQSVSGIWSLLTTFITATQVPLTSPLSWIMTIASYLCLSKIYSQEISKRDVLETQSRHNGFCTQTITPILWE